MGGGIGKPLRVEKPQPKPGDEEYFKAVQEGDIEFVKTAVEREGRNVDDPDPTCPDWYGGFRSLHWASYKAHYDLVRYLAVKGADTNARDWTNRTPLDVARDQKTRKFLQGYTRHVLFAAEIGDFELLRYFVEVDHQDVNTVEDGHTPLTYAVEGGHFDIVDYLISKGAGVNVTPKDSGISPLLCATYAQNLELCKLLRKSGADIQSVDPSVGYTPLHAAVTKENYEIVEFFVNEKANLFARDAGGHIPLDLARTCYNEDILRLLNIKVRHIVYAAEISDFDLLSRFVEGKEEVNMPPAGERPTSERSAREDGKVTARDIILTDLPYVDTPDPWPAKPEFIGMTALHFAAEKSFLEGAKYLLSHGANINAIDNRDRVPFHLARGIETQELLHREWRHVLLAAERNELDNIMKLLKAGKDVNVRDEDGFTCLHWAAYNGRLDIVEALLKAGADISPRDSRNRMPVDVAQETDVLHYLNNQMRKAHYCAQNGDVAGLINHLKKDPSLLNAQEEYPAKEEFRGFTPLHWACDRNQAAVLKYLIDQGADCYAKDARGRVPLDLLRDKKAVKLLREHMRGQDICFNAEWGKIEKVKNLVEQKNADLNSRDSSSEACDFTAIHWAAFKNNGPLVNYLVTRGADVALLDKRGRKPLDLAQEPECRQALNRRLRELWYLAEHGQLQEIQHLIPRDTVHPDLNKPDPYPPIPDCKGYTPLHWAVTNQHVGVAKFLLERGADPQARDERNRRPLAIAKTDEMILLIHQHIRRLSYAAEFDDIEMVRRMLNKNFDPNEVDPLSRELYRPLHWASMKGNMTLAQMLIEAGADVFAKDYYGRLAVDMCEDGDTRRCLQEATRTIHFAAETGDTNLLKRLCEGGLRSKVNDKDPWPPRKLFNGYTALHWAARRGHADIIRYLLTKCDADVHAVDDHGFTPLDVCEDDECLDALNKRVRTVCYAAEVGDVESLELFINKDRISPSLPDPSPRKPEFEGWQPVHYAAANGQAGALRLLLQKGAQFDAQNNQGQTPLDLAKGEGARRLLLGHLRGICFAAEICDKELINFFVEIEKQDVNMRDPAPHRECGTDPDILAMDESHNSGFRPLHWAADEGHLDTVDLLCQLGADIWAEDDGGRKPVEVSRNPTVRRYLLERMRASFVAVEDGDFEALEAIIRVQGESFDLEQSDPFPALEDHKGMKLLHRAADLANEGMVTKLLQLGSNPWATDDLGRTALEVAMDPQVKRILNVAIRGPCYAAEIGDIDVLRSIADFNVDMVDPLPPTEETKGYTSLHWAADKGHFKVLEHLIVAGANVDAVAENGLTPHHIVRDKQIEHLLFTKARHLPFAAQTNDLDLLRELVTEKPTKINISDPWPQSSDGEGFTALHWAASNDNIPMISYLVEMGANSLKKDRRGRMPLELARASEARRILNESTRQLCYAAEIGAVDMVKHLLDLGSDISIVDVCPPRDDNTGFTALHWASDKGHAEVCQILLEKGIDPRVEDAHLRVAWDLIKDPVVASVHEGYS